MSDIVNQDILDLVNNPERSVKLRQERYRANCALLDILKAAISYDSGEQRFGQLLVNAGFVKQAQFTNDLNMVPDNGWTDEYYLEPKVLLERVKIECAKVFG